MIAQQRPLHVVALVLLTGLLAGCGGADSPGSAPSVPASPSATPSTTPSTTVSPEPTTTAPPVTTAPHGSGATITPRHSGGSPGGTGGGTETRPGAALLWPVTDRAKVAPLQAQVDGGAQPWLLDPAEVAVNFAAATYDWRAPEAGPVNGNTVVVTDAQGGRATVTLTQPGRTGPTGIWVVTAAQRS
ncbi:hypothetical protein [Pseudonocardia acidicola]|uniref:Uncharacterized protein n=1 Tax=Pseudonocardia acidicola TaxID=2724939 RepID=A0ABX1SJV2_9PSEU|nr:hypothetical protein [Pseudonocardia acidicola]NMI01845.1 hypothetical protein [Pseudonocardia acidicola]